MFTVHVNLRQHMNSKMIILKRQSGLAAVGPAQCSIRESHRAPSEPPVNRHQHQQLSRLCGSPQQTAANNTSHWTLTSPSSWLLLSLSSIHLSPLTQRRSTTLELTLKKVTMATEAMRGGIYVWVPCCCCSNQVSKQLACLCKVNVHQSSDC